MVQEDNVILNLPFDESAGSSIAYDYSVRRTDGTVVNAEFVAGKQGNCLKFDGSGHCDVQSDSFPVSGNFTLLAWFKRAAFPDGFTGKKIGLMFATGEVEGYVERWYEINEDTWGYWGIVKNAREIYVYLDTQLIDTIQLPANLTGFSLQQDIYSKEYALGFLDQCIAYSVALTQDEIIETLNSIAELSYKLNGVDFKDYDIYVSESNGLLDKPAYKEPLKIDWDDYHGEVVDLKNKRLQAREITLNCFMKAEGKIDFVQKLNNFLDQFDADGTQRLEVDIHPTKPLIYDVYLPSGLSVTKRWNDTLMVGTFSLKLREPDPVKRIVRFQRTDSATVLNVQFTSPKITVINWGDGTTEEVSGTVNTSHTYTANGIYYASIAGVIERITNFSTNGILVWNKL